MTMTLKQINQGIGQVKRSYGAANEKVQSLALAIIEHSQKHGDCSPAARLARALPKKMRPSLTGWLAAFSPIAVRIGETVKDDTVSLRKTDHPKYKAYDLKGANALKWFDFEAETQAELITLTKFREGIAAYIKRLENKVKNGEFVKEDIPSIEADIRSFHALYQNNGKREATPAMVAPPIEEEKTKKAA